MAEHECKHYQFEEGTTTRRTRGLTYPDGGGRQATLCAWCTHPTGSPIDEETAKGTVSGPDILKCDGEWKKCPFGYNEW